MTDQSPESRDPWAPPEQPAVELGKQQGGAGTPGTPGVHDQQTVTGMPAAGGGIPQAAPAPAPAPQPGQAPGGTPAYGYPAHPDPAGYGYPSQPGAPQDPYGGYPGQQSAYGTQPVQPGYPAHPGYQGYPGYAPYPPKSNGFGITALVLGILAVVTCYLGLLFGIPAVIFGVLGRGKAKRGEADNEGMALAGIITGAVGILISCVFIALMIFGFMLGDSGSGSDWDSDYSTQVENTQVLHRS
ncbi:DUF4190 domain-containing protein [Streptomyces sp. NPDC056773]|uniref:DUF4190 domain-containing protein n=1 Tax=unclassified Streptomyces TaxID=2593676 RepID=UPI00367DE9F1